MHSTVIKYQQLLTGLVLFGLFLASPALMSALYPAVYPDVSFSSFYTGNSAWLLTLACALANLMAGCYQVTLSGFRQPLQRLASVCLLLAGWVSAGSALGRLSADPRWVWIDTAAVALLLSAALLHILCNLHRLNPAGTSRHRPGVGDTRETRVMTQGRAREGGSVKWFNVAKGFGFITRDQGGDVFVHYRAIKGEGHRTLSEGQRVEFVVAKREKGLQAEEVCPCEERY